MATDYKEECINDTEVSIRKHLQNVSISSMNTLVKDADTDEVTSEYEILGSSTASLTESNHSYQMVSDTEVTEACMGWSIDTFTDDVILSSLEASTQIIKQDGYCEAIGHAQSTLDDRLLAYSRYHRMTPRGEEVLVKPRKPMDHSRDFSKCYTDVIEQPVTVCLGWQKVNGVDACSRDLLRLLEEEGVTYVPHDVAYSVKYLAPVLPNGDCLFLSLEQLLLYSEECEPIKSSKIRKVGTSYFLTHYSAVSLDEKLRIDQTIQNLYCPSLEGGWAVSTFQTRRYIALRSERDSLLAKCIELQEMGYSRLHAAEYVYSQHAIPIIDAQSYAEYINVGNIESTHFLISLTYTRHGLVSVDTDDTRVSWGDDIILESLATAYQRDIFVVLVGCGKVFFLPHRPKMLVGNTDKTLSHRSKGLPPWFLLMRLTGSDRGGDHYEPMLCERLRGDGSHEFGEIGD